MAGGAGGVQGPAGLSGGYSVQANASAKLSLGIENKWVNILEALGFSGSGGALSSLVSGVANAAQIFSGENFLPNIATTHVWRGSTGLEISLQLRFDAWDDAGQDVLAPVQKLIQMFAPTRSGPVSIGTAAAAVLPTSVTNFIQSSGQWFIQPPGPTPYQYISNQAAPYLITLSLGNVLTIGNLIPTNLTWEFEERYTSAGDPVCALVTVGFITYTLPMASDLLAMFRNQIGSAVMPAVVNVTNGGSAPPAAPPSNNPGDQLAGP